MENQLFFQSGSDIKGPTRLENIFLLAQQGNIQENSKISPVEKEKWHLAKDVEGIFSWHLYCPSCEQKLLADFNVYGSDCPCPRCGHTFTIPPPDFNILSNQGGLVLLDLDAAVDDAEQFKEASLDLIRQNPYYVIGIFAGATQRSINHQKRRISAYREIGKEIETGLDIDLFGIPDRSGSSVQKAFASIDNSGDSLFHSLFWFTNHNHIDDTALNYLKSGDVAKAEEIWRTAKGGKGVTKNNFTALNNLGTLKIGDSFESNSFNPESLREGITLKTELLFSNLFVDFCHLVADETYTVDPASELELFLQSLISELTTKGISKAEQILSLLSQSHSKLNKIISDKFSQKSLRNIESKIEKTRKQIKGNRSQGLNLAKKLYLGTSEDSNYLCNILGSKDLKYTKIADKIAGEMLHCCCVFFNNYLGLENSVNHSQTRNNAKTEIEMGKEIIATLKLAEAIATATKTKNSIKDNINVAKQWEENAYKRENHKLVADDIEFIKNKLDEFNEYLRGTVEKESATPSNIFDRFYRVSDAVREIVAVEALIDSCRPKLQNIRNTLDERDELYLNISSAVVSNAQGALVYAVNEAQKAPPQSLAGNVEELGHLLREARRVSEKMAPLDMKSELMSHYVKNHRTLESIIKQFSLIREQPIASTTNSEYGHELLGTLIWIGIIALLVSLATCAG